MEKTRGAGASWGIFIAVLICGISYAVSLMAVPACAMQMMMYFQDDGTAFSWFMSIMSVSGTIIAVFTGAIQSKIGPKMMLILGVACVIIGDAICWFAAEGSDGVLTMYIGRFILGLSNGLIATAAPTMILILFPAADKRGIPNAVWSMWIALGSIIILNLAASLMGDAGNWKNPMMFAIIVGVVAMVLLLIFVRVPKEEQMAVVGGGEKFNPLACFASGWVWLCLIMMLCFAFCFSCYSGLATTYYQVVGGMDTATANTVSSLLNFIGIISGFIIGVILQKAKNHTVVQVGVFILVVIACATEFLFTNQTAIIVTMVIFGIALNIVVPCVFTNLQWASKNPAIIGSAMGMMAIASNGGGIPATPVSTLMIGDLTQAAGWTNAIIVPTIIAVIGLVCAIVYFVGRGKVSKEGIAAAKAAA